MCLYRLLAQSLLELEFIHSIVPLQIVCFHVIIIFYLLLLLEYPLHFLHSQRFKFLRLTHKSELKPSVLQDSLFWYFFNISIERLFLHLLTEFLEIRLLTINYMKFREYTNKRKWQGSYNKICKLINIILKQFSSSHGNLNVSQVLFCINILLLFARLLYYIIWLFLCLLYFSIFVRIPHTTWFYICFHVCIL